MTSLAAPTDDRRIPMPAIFDETITTRKRLREIVSGGSGKAANKEIDHIDDICRRFIACSPLVLISTLGADGLMDISPKGDPAGFVAVLDERTLAIPDRLGNNRLDTFENLLVNPEVGLIFVIPGHGDTLRVSGNGKIVRDAALQRRFAVRGREPNLVLVISVAEAFTHCSKAMVRSGLWRPERWPDRSNVPSLAEAMVAHGRLGISRERMNDIIDEDRRARLY